MIDLSAIDPKILEQERFQAPPGWQWDYETIDGVRLRYGWSMPDDAKGCVIILPGLSEFAEKFFETARDIMARGYGIFMMDWRGQGGSDRYASPDPNKRLAQPFKVDVEQLHHLLTTKGPDIYGSAPLYMVGNSMGGCLGTLLMQHDPKLIDGALLVAPFYGLEMLSHLPLVIQRTIAASLNFVMSDHYVPGGRAWPDPQRFKPGDSIFSHDHERDSVHAAWLMHQPNLQTSNATYKWIYEALTAGIEASSPTQLKSIPCPVHMICATEEVLSDNKLIKRIASHIPNCTVEVIEGARHEVLMEIDAYRNRVLEAFEKIAGST